VFTGVDLSPRDSAVVTLNRAGVPVAWHHIHEENTKRDLMSRFRMYERARVEIREQSEGSPDLVALEDYNLGPGQHVSYQIAEVAGLLKYDLIAGATPLVLINPRKRQSFVRRTKTVTKDDVLAWVEQDGFHIPVKTRGKNDGFVKKAREDLADAYVLAKMAHILHTYLSEGCPPRSGDIFLDPDTGLAFRDDLLFNNWFREELDATAAN
jgi:hypothetical protein